MTELRDHKYKKIIGESVKTDEYGDETRTPYAIEAFLVKKQDKDAQATVRTTFNKSVTYDGDPFKLEGYSKLSKDLHRADTLTEALTAAKFTHAKGVELVVNVVNPAPEFTDKAKTHINAKAFQKDLLKAVDSVTKEAIKEVKAAERERRSQNRSYSVSYAPRRTSREDMMREFFIEAYQHAKGDYAAVAARQVFYVIRAMANRRYGESFTASDYNRFTQKVCTDFEQAGYKIVFERRGFFVNPFDNDEMPLGTLDVEEYISKLRGATNQAIRTDDVKYSLSPEYMFNKVLFIEKQGFTPMFKSANLLKDWNLGVISTQGLGTRAAKSLMLYFRNCGIDVYILHDCDVAGYLIADKLKYGSETFLDAIDAVDIGLNVQDVYELDKQDEVEEVTYKARQGMSHITDKDALDFFDEQISGYGAYRTYTYQRLELNTLTNDELIAFIKEKIPKAPILPGDDVFRSMAQDQFEDSETMLKEAVYAAFLEGHEDILEDPEIDKAMQPDIDSIIGDVVEEVKGNGAHWINALKDRSNTERNRIVEDMTGILRGMPHDDEK